MEKVASKGLLRTRLIVVTHVVVDDNLGRLNVGFDANAFLEVRLVAGAVLTLGNIDCRVEVVVRVVLVQWLLELRLLELRLELLRLLLVTLR